MIHRSAYSRAHPRSRHWRGALWLALVAACLQAWATLGVMPRHGSAPGTRVAQLCTAAGLAMVEIPAPPENTTHAVHGCCAVCTGSAPARMATVIAAVLPAPTSAAPTPFANAPHVLAFAPTPPPRAPPVT